MVSKKVHDVFSTLFTDVLGGHVRDGNFIELVLKGQNVKRVLIIGEAGVGKSSLVNLLLQNNVAEVSDQAVGCTFSYSSYSFVENGNELWQVVDTVGLNEQSRGKVSAKEAMKMLITFIKKNKRGFNIVVMVAKKGRIFDNFEKNHFLFVKALLKNTVPCVLMITGCENDEPMDSWKNDKVNQAAMDGYHFVDTVCGTGLQKGRIDKDILKQLNEETRETLLNSLRTHMKSEPYILRVDLTLFQTIVNTICDWFGWSKKFITDTYDQMLTSLKQMFDFSDEYIQEIKETLH